MTCNGHECCEVTYLSHSCINNVAAASFSLASTAHLAAYNTAAPSTQWHLVRGTLTLCPNLLTPVWLILRENIPPLFRLLVSTATQECLWRHWGYGGRGGTNLFGSHPVQVKTVSLLTLLSGKYAAILNSNFVYDDIIGEDAHDFGPEDSYCISPCELVKY